MNERELSLIRALGEEFSLALGELRESFRKSLSDYQQTTEEHLTRLSLEVASLKDTPAPDFTTLLADAVASLPVPETPELPDIGTMVSEAVAAIPAPQDGKSVTVDEILPVLEKLVSKAVGEIPVPKDGKDYDPAVLRQAVDDAVSEAVAEIPAPEPGRPGEDGRDALALELLPFIDESKSYPRGSYATHNGGLWRAYEKTHGMRGWECVVDGVAGVDVSMEGMRNFTVTVNRASGASEKKAFGVPVMVYRGVFKSGDEYLPGDTVTWGGSLWHCDEQTQDKPGETGSKGWTLAAKRGRDGRDKT
ncbi:phage portal protein [Citrobacter koseri]|uniref:phage portal protein n=1 Tax=Citrobacter koseri TaxID=545 RepID=UPI0008A4C6C9|nr:phage portal protein [Citrobacter koseri]OFV11343.1 phage portal protein [Salmonella sp. HMSC13B08]MDU3849974.1 phage gp6-like head-tail connector protein [Citrobacter koseri]HAZ8272829.1 phage gp6-like head-tail connector protein [Citrobacter koseri]HBA1382201.1 phage gp6-like head-tail connector protein [Citrobacter koseri]HBA1404470.1 phage gp6-like head-tail connector protein [Citrobacter koseri]